MVLALRDDIVQNWLGRGDLHVAQRDPGRSVDDSPNWYPQLPDVNFPKLTLESLSDPDLWTDS
jgi:hypothetical protein